MFKTVFNESFKEYWKFLTNFVFYEAFKDVLFMTTFSDLGLPSNIVKSVEKIGFTTPTPIQEQAIPVALQGKDILGSAQTGTGKTASFILPILAHLWENQTSCALVILPTRELAMQVTDATRDMMAGDSSIRIAQLIGGDSMLKQINSLTKKPRIIVGTPGRINDHLKRGNLKLKNTDFLVLDETDRMLDMGFGIQIEAITNFLPQQRQTLMFSATMPKNIVTLAGKYLNDPVRISIGEVNAVAKNIRQELVKTSESDKYPNLVEQIKDKSGSTIIFVKTKVSADRLATKLCRDSIEADAIHGDLRQGKRQAIIRSFRNEKFKILVATDVAARGLDVPHIENVVNYDLPQCPEDYIHRIGRTARAGASGIAINLITPQDGRRWKDIHKLLNPNEKSDYDYDVDFSRQKKSSRRGGEGKGRGRGAKSSMQSRKNEYKAEATNNEFFEGYTSEPSFKKSAKKKVVTAGAFGKSAKSDRGSFGKSERSFGAKSDRGFGDKSERSFGAKSDRGSFGSDRGFKKSADSFGAKEGTDRTRVKSSFGKSEKSDRGFGKSEKSFGKSDRGSFSKSNDRNKSEGFGGRGKFGKSDFAKPKGSFDRKPRAEKTFSNASDEFFGESFSAPSFKRGAKKSGDFKAGGNRRGSQSFGKGEGRGRKPSSGGKSGGFSGMVAAREAKRASAKKSSFRGRK